MFRLTFLQVYIFDGEFLRQLCYFWPSGILIPFIFFGVSVQSDAEGVRPDSSCEPQWDEQFGVQGLVNEGNPAISVVFALKSMDDPLTGSQSLFATGGFLEADGVPANQVAKWDGQAWSALGNGLGGDSNFAGLVISEFDGDGSQVVVGGLFFENSAPGNFIAQWDGSSWSDLGDGTSARVESLNVFDGALYAGGRFSTVGGTDAEHVARWDGMMWSPVGGGLSGLSAFALEVFDDGNGPALYATGIFSFAYNCPNGECPVEVNHIAKWDGKQWSALGGGLDLFPGGMGWTLEVFDDGRGPALYVGGAIDGAGGVEVSGIARWDGQTWSSVGGGTAGAVRSLEVYDDGNGPSLYAGGFFNAAGGVSVNNIARWDGESWSPLGAGVDGIVWSMAGLDDENVRALYVGGDFDSAGGAPAYNIARWITCPVELPGDFDEDGDVDAFDFAAYLNCYGGPGGNISLSCRAFDFDEDLDVDRHDFAVFQRAFTGP